MNLNVAKLKTKCLVKDIKIIDEKTKFRLMELGLTKGTLVEVAKRSVLKKTLLIIFNASCFTLKSNLASEIVVVYA